MEGACEYKTGAVGGVEGQRHEVEERYVEGEG